MTAARYNIIIMHVNKERTDELYFLLINILFENKDKLASSLSVTQMAYLLLNYNNSKQTSNFFVPYTNYNNAIKIAYLL